MIFLNYKFLNLISFSYSMVSRVKLSEYYVHQHHNIRHLLELCKSHADDEMVHEFRLSIKKLRAFNELAGQLCLNDTIECTEIKNRARQLYKLAGQLRDTQVQIHMLSVFEEQTDTVYPEFSKWLFKREKKRISRFSRKLQNKIPRVTKGIAFQKIERRLANSNDIIMLDTARKVLEGMLFKARELVNGNLNNQNLHRLRIIIKKKRNVINIIRHSYPDFHYQGKSVDSLLEIETSLGHWHDKLFRIELLGRFMEKLNLTDYSAMDKYQKLFNACNSELENAFAEAIMISKRELNS
jgi:CHAD domain-containing protein